MRPLLLLAISGLANAALIDFEDQTDGTNITSQYPGITFTNATVLTAGIGLNEFDFPPHSGTNVIFDDGGPITVTFVGLIFGFTAYITYVTPITIDGYDDTNALVATATTLFGNNTGLGGEPGSSPNEPLVISFPGGMSRVTIAGEPTGGSFSLDDTTRVTSSVPEPGSYSMLALALLALTISKAGKKRFIKQQTPVMPRMNERHCLAFVLIALCVQGCGSTASAAPGVAADDMQASVLESNPIPITTTRQGLYPNAATLGVAPETILVNQTTRITAVAQLSNNPALINDSVVLLRYNPHNESLLVFARMYDDGTHGDKTLGDRVFTAQFSILEREPTTVYLKASAAYQGQLARPLSNPVAITVFPPIDPQRALNDVAAQIEAGDLAGAAMQFSDKRQNRERVRQMNATFRPIFSAALRNARFDHGDNLQRTYKLTFKNPDGTVLYVDLELLRDASGGWMINFW